ncbi:MAG: radical SAM family heme chaperone HemW [Gammaproteobacteria bacterium]|nr:radical SAM family heme chaperone HemW [Gammaproteobacteria bacterium]
MSETPPLALYVHIPWCLQKCPYCDFNSHAVAGGADESAYVAALLQDLERELSMVADRELSSIFIGGGTPSLFSGAAIARVLAGVRSRLACVPDMEVTLEANPGAVDQGQFAAYRDAGVNRLSIGIQSFAAAALKKLGRIHGPDEAVDAMDLARRVGFENINLDLMYGLPGQTQDAARQDLIRATSMRPEHLSYYQLTIEPNTMFHSAPPILPDDEHLWQIESGGHELLQAAGYRQYEVSAFARPGFECRHNRNYWEFGDYLGIGAGAHGKITDPAAGLVYRSNRTRSPEGYVLAAGGDRSTQKCQPLSRENLVLEFMLNALRLRRGFQLELFERRTGLALKHIQPGMEMAVDKGLLELDEMSARSTEMGRRFLNELLAIFLPVNNPAD